MTEAPIRALGFAGSLRATSYNRALLRAVVARAPAGLVIETFDLEPLPLYHGDVERAGDPEPVAALKRAVREADLVLIATPEYNQGIPAVTKNAVDWGSRPPRPHAWEAKPVAIMGVTPGRLGTVSAQRALRESLSTLNGRVMPQPRLLLSGARDLFSDDLHLVDGATLDRVDRFLTAAVEWARRFPREPES